jgi:hypothetical protein
MSKRISQQDNILHITTDALTAEHLDNSLSQGVFLAWQDALYEGPIDAQSNLTQLSRRRATYFVNVGWGEEEDIAARYQARNKQLFTYHQYDEVVLWFDHDLNSQLQMVQLIEWFSHHKMNSTILSTVSIERLPGISSYLGLNMLSSDSIQSLMSKRWEVTLGQMTICRHAWRALGSNNPNAILRFYHENTSTMPYLKNAILRFLKQFPSQENGLSQSEALISQAVLQQKNNINDIYLAMQSKEGIPFMNRALFSICLQNMCKGKMPMIEKKIIESENVIEEIHSDEGEFEEVLVEKEIALKLTHVGRQVLHNWVDWVQVNGINRWLGGVQLKEGSLWRYDQQKRKLIKTYV